MRAHQALAALSLLAATTAGAAQEAPAAPGIRERADDLEPGAPEGASHLTMCLAVAGAGQAAREHFCDLLQYYPKPSVQGECSTKVARHKLFWQAWCQLTFGWPPWRSPGG